MNRNLDEYYQIHGIFVNSIILPSYILSNKSDKNIKSFIHSYNRNKNKIEKRQFYSLPLKHCLNNKWLVKYRRKLSNNILIMNDIKCIFDFIKSKQSIDEYLFILLIY